jgi:transposase
MDVRELKALEIAARMRIIWEDGAWSVPSASGKGKYRVVLKPDGNTCTCPNHELTGKDCKHILAARFVMERDHGGEALLIDTDTLPEKKTYKQDWPKYNEAQMTEKKRFLALLHDLCRGVESPPQTGPGRRRTPLADMVFAATFKVYSGFSSRRFACDLADAQKQGYLSQTMNSVSVCAFLESEAMTPVLHALIVQSSLPLRAVEQDFAVDSTGFCTSRFTRWYDHKYGQVRQEHDWVKAHFCTGVRSNVVTGVRILDKNAADCPQFVPLVQEASKTFKVSEVSGDKAYSALENLEAVEALGGTPFVAFKVDASPNRGGLWEKILSYFLFRREEFLSHYHKRSNVESTVNMVKSKFRDHVRSRTDVAMKNEVLCKFLCHNLCVVHQSHVELGIEPVFWPEEAPPEGPKHVLRFPG